ncbi:MAG: tetratricopeptide (TPR) repeat protein [Cognaticolwellia sp.]|jgi:tetratricopeptide (TPR) repeat protein
MAKKNRKNKSRSKPSPPAPSPDLAALQGEDAAWAKKPTAKASPTKEPPGLRLNALWIPVLLVALTVLLYAQTLNFDYALDDNSVISSNRWVQQGLAGVLPLFESSYWEGFFQGFASYYRPLPMISYALEFELFGFDPGISHGINVAMYAGTAALVYALFHRLTGSKGASGLGAALFVLSPLHVEVSANIKSRDELMALALQLGVLLLGVDLAKSSSTTTPLSKTGRSWRVALALLCMLAALLTKENALITVALLPLTLWCGTKASPKAIAGWSAALTLPPLLPYFIQRYRVTGHVLKVQGEDSRQLLNNAVWAAQDWSESAGMIFWMFADYAKLLLWPRPLIWDRSLGYIPIAELSHPQALLGVLLALVLAGLLIWQLPKRSIWAWTLGWMAIAYAIPSNVLVQVVGSTMAERYLYLLTVGFCGGLAWGFAKLADRYGRWVWATGAALALLWGGLSLERIPDWQDTAHLVAADYPKSAGNPRIADSYLGLQIRRMTLAASGEEKRAAQAELQAVLQLSKALLLEDELRYRLLAPGMFWAAGSAAFTDQDWPQAREHFEALVRHKPNHFQGWWRLGYSCFELQDYPCSSAAYYEALTHRPKQGFAPGDDVLLQDYYFNLCLVEQKLGAWEESLESCEGALYWEPNHARATAGVGIAHQMLGNQSEADRFYEKAFALDPSLRPQ